MKEKEEKVLSLLKIKLKKSDIIKQAKITSTKFDKILKKYNIEYEEDARKEPIIEMVKELISKKQPIDKIANQMGYSYNKMIGFLKKNNIVIPYRKRKVNYAELKDFYKNHPDCSTKEMGKIFNVGGERIRQILVNELKLKTKVKEQKDPKKYSSLKNEIIKKIEESDKTREYVRKLKQEYSIKDRNQLKKQCDFTIEREFYKIREQFIIELFRDNHLNPIQIGKRLKMNSNRIRNILEKNNLHGKESYHRKKRNEEIRHLYKKGMSLIDLSKKFNLTYRLIEIVVGKAPTVIYKS